MKRAILSILALAILIPSVLQAAPISWDFNSGVLQPLQSAWGAVVRGSYFQATSTVATSTFPRASSTTFCLGSDCRTSWPSGGSGGLATSTPWTPGGLAYAVNSSTVSSVATGTLTETVSGLQFDAIRGLVGGSAVLSLTSGFEVPLTASTSQWQTAFGWGNHASAGYLSTTSGNWSGTFDGLEGALYLSRANHTGTQPSTTITGLGTLAGLSSVDLTSNVTGILPSSNIEDAYVLNTGDSISGNLTFSGSSANAILGSNYLSGDGGDEGVFVTSAGDVGVGTSTPQAKLGVAGSIYAGTGSFAGSANLYFSQSGSSLMRINSDTSGNPEIRMMTDGSTRWTWGVNRSDSNKLLIVANTTLSGTNGLTLDTSGNLGVGTSSPSRDLTVVGDAQITGLVSCDTIDTDAQGNLSCGTDGGGGSGGLATSSPWTNGDLAYVTGSGLVGSVATGTLTETVSGLELNATRALVGGSAILALTSGFNIPLTASTSEWNTFYTTPSNRITAGTGIDWTGNTLNGVYTAGDALTLTGEDFDFDGGATPSGELGGTWASPTIDDSLAVTGWNLTSPTLTSFFGTPCTTGEFLTDISDTGTFTCATGGGGGGGGTLSTSTDIIGAPGTVESLSYVNEDFLIGGSNSTTAEFKFDPDGGTFLIGSSTGTGTIASAGINQALRIGDDIGSGLEWIFSTVGDAILETYGAVTRLVVTIAETVFQGNVDITGQLMVATTTYYGATTSDAIVTAGNINTGEWMYDECITPQSGVTQVIADTEKYCNSFYVIEDTTGLIDKVSPQTSTSSYFRLRPGTGTTVAAGDGMGIGWAQSRPFGRFPAQHLPAIMEWTMRLDGIANGSSSIVQVGLTDLFGGTANLSSEAGYGIYVIATSTSPNFYLACNPNPGTTSYIDTGIPTSTSATLSNNFFNHWRLEITGTASSSVSGVLKVRTLSNQTMTTVASCTNISLISTLGAPLASIGKSTAGLQPELHIGWLKFWWREATFY